MLLKGSSDTLSRRPMKKDWSDIGIGLIALLSILLAAWTLKQRLSRPPIDLSQIPRMKDWRQIAATGHEIGNRTAADTIVEFSDFECPFCAQTYHSLEALQGHGDVHLAIVYRHYPLRNIHPFAYAAAIASECAAAQGRFKSYYDLLFSEQSLLGTKSWMDFARDAGVSDTVTFRRCLSGPIARSRVDQDIRDGGALAITGTPTLIVNGYVFTGGFSPDELNDRIQAVHELHARRSFR